MSSANLTETKAVSEETHKSGMSVMGHIVPWWVVIAVVLLLAYLLYDMLFTGKTVRISGPVTLTPQAGGFEGIGLDTPAQLKELFAQ